MKTDLLGVWSADALFAPGSQEDEILVFRSDGTGWFEWMNYAAHEIEFFEWITTSPGWLALASQRRIERDPHNLNSYLEVARTFDTQHLPFIIEEVETPLYGTIPRLELEIVGAMAGTYGLTGQDVTHPEIRPKPV